MYFLRAQLLQRKYELCQCNNARSCTIELDKYLVTLLVE